MQNNHQKSLLNITAVFLLSTLVVFAIQVPIIDTENLFPKAYGGATPITPGDIFLAHEDLTFGITGVMVVEPVTGQQKSILDFSDIALDMKTDSNGDLIILTENGVVRFNPNTLVEEEIASVEDDLMLAPRGMDLNSIGDIIVLDDDEENGLIIKIDPVTGSETLLFSDSAIVDSIDIAIEPSGDILVLNDISIYRVDTIGGTATLLSSDVLGGTHTLITNDAGDIFTAGSDVVKIDPITGVATTLSSGFSSITGIAIEADGNIIVVESDADSIIHRVDPVSGVTTIVSSGGNLLDTFGTALSVLPLPVVDLDADDDGINDDLDLQPAIFSDDFDDLSLGGTTDGIVVDRADQTLTISEEANPDGVRVNADASGGATPGEVEFCSSMSSIEYNAGDETVVTCSSVTITVISGQPLLEFESLVATEGTTTLSAGNSITFEQSDFSFTAPATNTETIIISVGGEDTSIPPGSTVLVPPTPTSGSDTDSDGINDDLDLQPTIFSDDFNDLSLGGTTDGLVVDRGDQTLTISEEVNPDGIRVNADVSGGSLVGEVEFCDGASFIELNPGDEAVVTCSSVIVTVISGQPSLTFIGIDNTEATTTLSAGNSITFEQDTFSFTAPATNTETVIIEVEGTPITIDPGETNTSPPEVGIIIAVDDPVEIETLVEVNSSFTDLGSAEVHTAVFDWGDETTSAGIVTENGLSGTVTGSHTYSTPGVYTITLTVTDDNGDSGSSIFQFVVVYDPLGGFVTGGGWIDSPTGAYVVQPSLVGKASFGFVSKYQNGQNVPTGNTQFSFKVGDLKFKSTEYDWLVIAGNNAKFKGTGTIAGQGNYGFQLFGFDADLNLNDPFEDDKFRIKIWDKNNGDVVVYDNNLGESENGEPSTILGGGSIVIHKP